MVNPDKIFGRLSNRMFQMAALYAYCKDNNYPIFVQDEKYFKKYEQEIRQLYGEGIKKYELGLHWPVGIHVRRAKNPINPQEPAYSENPFYVDLGHHLHEDMTDNYYVRAMQYFKDLDPTLKFVVFSDDIFWCQEQEIFKGCEFSSMSEIEDMNHMAGCQHNIIANSSFSWWSAYLNPNPDKIVIGPKQWYADLANEPFTVRPESWVKL